MKNVWKYEVTKNSMLILLGCLTINLFGKLIAELCNFPVWMDAFGTFAAAYIYGPAGGMIVGGMTHILYGLVNPLCIPYAIIGIIIGLAAGIFMRKEGLVDIGHTMITCFVISWIAILLSMPLNILLHEGYSTNYWGDALFDMLAWNNTSHTLCAFVDVAVVEFLDKEFTLLIIYFVFHCKKIKLKKLHKCHMFFILLFFAMAFLSPKKAEAANSFFSEYMSTVYDNQNGLPTSDANAIVQTEDGYIWIGGYAGLIKYNGTSFELILESGISSVTSLHIDNLGRLWIGTNDSGLCLYENEKYVFYTKDDGLSSNSIRDITSDQDGNLYIATTDALCMLSNGKIEKLESPSSYLISIAVNTKGIVSGISNAGEIIFWQDKKIISKQTIQDVNKIYTSVMVLKNNCFLAGTSYNSLVRFEVRDGIVSKADVKHTKTLSSIIDLSYDREGNIWICADNGIGVLIDNTIEVLAGNSFNNSIEEMYQDYEGNYWFVSSRCGVMKLCKSQIVNLYDAVGMDDQVVNAVTVFNGLFYFGTDTGLSAMNPFNNAEVKNVLTRRLENERIRCLYVDSNKQLWICCYGGEGLVCYTNSGKIISYNKSNSVIQNDHFHCVYELEDGTIVAGSKSGLCYIKDGVVLTDLINNVEVMSSQILCITQAEDKTILVGTDGNGIFVLKNRSVVGRISTENGLSSDVILRITKYKNGYFVVTSNALCYIDSDYIAHRIDKFPYFNNYDILLGKDDDLWVLSSCGVFLTKGADILNSGKQLEYIKYDTENGLFSSITTNSWNYSDDEYIYFACNNGVCRIPLEIQQDEYTKISVNISGVLAQDQPVPKVNSVYRLPAYTRNFSLVPEVMSFNVRDLKVRYYLDNIENSREEFQSELERIEFSNISYGKHEFHIQILNDANEAIEERIFTIYKEPQRWEHSYFYFYLTVVIIAITTLFLSVIVFLRNLVMRRKQLEDMRLLLEEKVEQITKENESLMLQSIKTICNTIDAKDPYTRGHSNRVAEYSVLIARRCGWTEDDINNLNSIALLHDIGKIRVPDSILNKPGKLTPEEYNMMKSHAEFGGEILKDIRSIKDITVGAMYHHERYDGTGYPHQIAGEQIPEVARIIAVADAFDAMTSNRCYRKMMTKSQVLKELENGKGKQFDPVFVEIIIKAYRNDEIGKVNDTAELDMKNNFA